MLAESTQAIDNRLYVMAGAKTEWEILAAVHSPHAPPHRPTKSRAQ
jgi:hypothetical protein